MALFKEKLAGNLPGVSVTDLALIERAICLTVRLVFIGFSPAQKYLPFRP